MKNYMWSVVVGIFIIAIVAAYFGLREENKYQQAQLAQQQVANNFSLSAKCADQAQKTFDVFKAKYTNDGWDASAGAAASTRVDFNQINHFNEKLNKCFVLITYDFTQAGLGNPNFTGNGESLLDAYENSELASCVHSDDFAKGQYTDTCLIGENNGLISYQNYKDFVNQRMETNQ